jgi:hypothetical protein
MPQIIIVHRIDPDWSKPDTSGTWRGEIGRKFNTSQWRQWFTNYQSFIWKYASLATTLNADMFSVGFEYESTDAQAALWRETVVGIRQRFSKRKYPSIIHMCY